MFQKIFLILIIFSIIGAIPIVDAQLNFGADANQKSIEVTINKSEMIHVKHVVSATSMPVNVKMFEGTISNLITTNENGIKLDNAVADDGLGNKSIVIFPTNKNTIINYDIENGSILTENMWKVKLSYDETYSILFSEEINSIFLNTNLIKLQDKKGISVNNGGNAIIQYYSEVPRIIKNVQWEEDKFNVEIISDSKINNFNFEQTSKSISFEINEENKLVSITMPEILLGGPYIILLDDEKIQYSKSIDEGKNISITMKPKSTGQITIIGTTVIPEFSMFIPLIMGFLVVLTVPFMKKISLH